MYSRPAFSRLKAKQIVRSVSAWLGPVALLLTAPSAALATPPPTVTYAGMQVTLTAALQGTGGVVSDRAGNIFIADSQAQKVIELPAGGGSPITLATSVRATDVAVDSMGKLYVSVNNLDHLLVYTPGSGAAPTNLGSGLMFASGVSVDVHGNIYVADGGNSRVVKLPAGGGPQTVVGSGLSDPFAAVADSSGNVYVADNGGGRIVEFLAGGGSTNIGSTGISPGGLTLDAAGNIFYDDGVDRKVYELPITGGRRTILSSSNNLGSLSTDLAGNLYVSTGDGSGHASALEIQLGAVDLGKINVCTTGTTPTPCTSSVTLNFNVDVSSMGYTALDAEALTHGVTNLDYKSTSNTCTGAFSSSGTCSITIQFAPLAPSTRLGAVNITGTPSGGTPATQATVYLHGVGIAPQAAFDVATISTFPIALLDGNYLNGLTVAANGDLYIVDLHNCVVQKYSGAVVSVVAGTGSCTPSGSTGDGSAATSATFAGPNQAALDGAGNLYVVDSSANNVRMIDASTGIISTVAGSGTQAYTADGALAAGSALDGPAAVAIDGAGNLYIAETRANVVRKVDARTGVLSTVAGNYQAGSGFTGDHGPATGAQLNAPNALALDSFGDLFIADNSNNAIRIVLPNGTIETIAGMGVMSCGYSGDGGPGTSAEICDPQGIAVDAAGNVYIADSSNDLVRKVNAASGVITTVAGVYDQGNGAYSGDGGSALKAGLSYLQAVVVDNNGNLLIADSDNGVIREVSTGEASAVFETTDVGSSSAAQDVTLTNVGNSPLVLTAVTPSTNFNVNGSDTSCTGSTTLAPRASCVLGIKFLPTMAGALTGSVVLADNNNNNPQSSQSVATSGTGTGATGGTGGSAPTRLVVSDVLVAITQGGNLGTVTATLEAAAGSIITSPGVSVTLTITGPGGFSATKTAATVNGIATFDLTGIPLSATGSYSVAVSSSGLPSQTFPVFAGQDFTLAHGSGAGSGSVQTQTVLPGSAAEYPLVLGPAGTIFSAPITLTATGLPPGATYSFSPAVITPGSASAATTLTIQTAKTTAALDQQNGFGGTLGGLALAALLLPLAGSRKLRNAAKRMPLAMVAFALLSGAAVVGLAGCAAGGLFGHQSSSFTITVVGTSGAISHSTTVHLTIQ